MFVVCFFLSLPVALVKIQYMCWQYHIWIKMKKNPFSFHLQRPGLTLFTVVGWSQLHLHWSCQTNSGSVSCMYFSIHPFSIASPFTGSWKGLEPIPAVLQLPGIGEAADKQAFMLIFTPKVILIYQCPKCTWELCTEETLATRALKPWTFLLRGGQG